MNRFVILALALVALPFVVSTGALAQSGPDEPATAAVEVTVWRRVSNPSLLYVSTRAEEGAWRTLNTALDMSMLSSSGRFHQSNAVLVQVPLQGGATAVVEVTVWRRLSNPSLLYVSTRPEGGAWRTLNTALDMSMLSSSGRFHQSNAVLVEVPLGESRSDRAQPASDRDVLVALYRSTGGANWVANTNWLSDRPIGWWHGVQTDSDGRVERLDLGEMWGSRGEPLGSNNLSGTIPAEVGNLTNLEVLRLQGNNLSGTIPAEIGNLANLRELQLQGNNLSGTIPAELGGLSNLTELGLSSNQLTGEIPPELGSLSNLMQLRLEFNRLTGEIPPELGGLSNLTWLLLRSNHLTGCIPEGLRDIEHNDLDQLNLPDCGAATDRAALIALYNATNGPNWNKSTNWLSDMPLRTWYGVQTDSRGRVVWLDLGEMWGSRGEPLGSNNLSGTIPAEVGNLTNLEVLRLQGNNLSGTIPAEIGNLTNLRDLQLQDNSLSGTIPAEIGNLTNLEQLSLGHNALTGPIPKEIGNLAGLDWLNLYHNDLEAGPIPVEFARLVGLKALFLDTRHCAPQGLEPWMRTQRFDVFPCTGPEDKRLLPRVLLREDSEGLSLALEDDLHDPLAVNVSDEAVVTVAIQGGWLVLSPRGVGEAEVEIVSRSGGTPANATVWVREAVGSFGIDIVMAQPTTDLYAETMAAAADRWSTVLNGTEWDGRDARDYCEHWKSNVPVSSSGNELVIWAVRETDPSYSAGGSAWTCTRGEGPETEPSHYYPVAGIVTVNARLAHSSASVGLIRHEIGHMLGLTGGFLPATGLVTEDWKYFVGPRAVAVFREGGGDPDLPGIPLSDRSHWSPGGPDVIVNAHDSDALSVAALADAGYTVDMSKAIPWRYGW